MASTSTSTPYWGELPGPKVAVVQTTGRRVSADANPTATDRRQSLDAPIQLQPKPKRASVQTTNTESTMSPFASPISSTFTDQGLAPRPPSFPYGSSRYPQHQQQSSQESTGRSRHRRDHSLNDIDDLADSRAIEQSPEDPENLEPPPAAPDVPRGPPISYRPPFSSPQLYAYPSIRNSAPRTARRPDLSLTTESMDVDSPEQYYMTAAGAPPAVALSQESRPRGPTSPHTSPRMRRESVSHDARPSIALSRPEESAARQQEAVAVGLQPGLQPGESGGKSRRVSNSGGQADRRKKLDEVRSPLQKLELTLDSITKEEKRARVAAAEQVAREREARGLPARAAPELKASRSQPRSHQKHQHQQQQQQQQQLSPQSQAQLPPLQAQQQVRFRERSGSIGEGEPRPLLQPETSPIEESYLPIAAHRGPLTQNPPEPAPAPALDSEKLATRKRQAVSRHAPSASAPVSGIPQRNLSFRERAARDDNIQLPLADEFSSLDPAGLPSSTAPQRHNSAKLKKVPPGDPWRNKRVEAEKRYHAQQALASAQSGSRAAYANTYVEQGLEADRRLQYTGTGTAMPSAGYAVSSSQRRTSASGYAAANIERSASLAANGRSYDGVHEGHSRSRSLATAAAVGGAAGASGAAAVADVATARRARFQDDELDGGSGERRFDAPQHHHISNMVYGAGEDMVPGQGRYQSPQYLEEWKEGTVGQLSGRLLDLADDSSPTPNRDKAWWEQPSRRRGSTATRPRRGEAFDGEYDEANVPTRFKPPLHLVCGPLLRYCGMRKERSPGRNQRVSSGPIERDIWRGSVLIVTRDTDSSYDIAPTLRLFLQPLELLPPPPSQVEGALPPEYVDPLVGHPKLGRNGETLYVRPVEQIDEAKDLSRDETDSGLFEKTKTPTDQRDSNGNASETPGSFASRLKRTVVDGERAGKFKDVRGFRLHAERGVTFWRFNIEVELRETQQRIAYRINRSPPTGFWVPAKGQPMHIMFHSCNGFSLSVNSNEFSGPDPLWRDVLNNHQTQPFHVMIGGGDQIYNDAVTQQTELFKEWLGIKNSLVKHKAAFTDKMQDELEDFYLNRYAMWFSQGLFSLANSQIPMVNMFDDHDIIDGFGSYPHHFMNSPVFAGLGNVAFKYYMLFQHQSVVGETEESEPSWILGVSPGPYIEEHSRSLFMPLGADVALLAVDCRTERMRDEVLNEETWKRIMDRCYAEIEKGKLNHLLVLLGVPIAYPRLVWLENILTSRLMDPIKALGKAGLLGNFLNRFDGGVEVLDDLDDHWTAKDHKDERKVVIEDLQDLAADKSIRVTILSGDVHLAAVGQFYSNPKLELVKHKDFRYMPNIISSAIVNTPPPDLLADVLNKRNKIHHFDKDTEEDMIPLFDHGVDGKARNNKRLLPHRNWCSIQPYIPGTTPPSTPTQSSYDVTPLETPSASKANVLRRPSTRRGPQKDNDVSRPPVSGGLMRTMSRGRASADNVRPEKKNASVRRSFSLSRDFRPGNLFRRLSGRREKKPDDGGINGNWGAESEEVIPQETMPVMTGAASGNGGANGYGQNHGQGYGQTGTAGTRQTKTVGPMLGDDDSSTISSVETISEGPRTRRGGRIRGGAGTAAEIASYGHNEYETGDDSYFSVKRRAAVPQPNSNSHSTAAEAQYEWGPAVQGQATYDEEEPAPRPFYRTPTGLSAKQMKRAQDFEVNLEGGLDIRLNVEVSPKDPTGITVPYRLVVPRLWYTYEGEELETEAVPAAKNTQGGGVKRWLSLGGGKKNSIDEGRD